MLDTGRPSDLAARGDGNRTRRHHNEIRDTESVHVRYRRGDFAFDDVEVSLASSVGAPARFLSSMMATSFSVSSSGTEIAAQRPPVMSWIVASMSSGEWLRP